MNVKKYFHIFREFAGIFMHEIQLSGDNLRKVKKFTEDKHIFLIIFLRNLG
jgi:hypothetical protein